MNRFEAVRKANVLKKEKKPSPPDWVKCETCGTDYPPGGKCAICDDKFFANNCQICNVPVPDEINVCHKCVEATKEMKKAATKFPGEIGISTAAVNLGLGFPDDP